MSENKENELEVFSASVGKQLRACSLYWYAFLIGVASVGIGIATFTISKGFGLLLLVGGVFWIPISGIVGAIIFPKVICPKCNKRCWSPWQQCWTNFCCSCGGKNHHLRKFQGVTVCNDCGATRKASKFPTLPPHPRKYCSECGGNLPMN